MTPGQNEHIDFPAPSEQIAPPQLEHASFDNPALTTAPTNVPQMTDVPSESLQEPQQLCSQERVTRIRREPTRLTYYAPGQSLHCQQNIVDASMLRPPNRPYMIPPPPCSGTIAPCHLWCTPTTRRHHCSLHLKC